MIYGRPTINVDDDQTDRIGIRTMVLSQMWQPSRWPMTMRELAAETPNVPETEAGMYFIGRQTRRVGGALRTSWSFEGIDGDGKSVTFKDRHNSLDYEFEPGFSQVAIEQHPDIDALMQQFFGSAIDGEIVWPPTIGGSVGFTSFGATSGLSLTEGAPRKNPLFGVKDFLRLDGTYTFRYAAFNLASIDIDEGRILKSGSLPGVAPSYAGRDWLKGPAHYRRRGPVYEITEIFFLSGPGGWPKQVYGTRSQR